MFFFLQAPAWGKRLQLGPSRPLQSAVRKRGMLGGALEIFEGDLCCLMLYFFC